MRFAYHRLSRPPSRYRLHGRQAALTVVALSATLFLFMTIRWLGVPQNRSIEAPRNSRGNVVITKIRSFPRGGDELKFDQPWSVVDLLKYEQVKDLDPSGRYVFGNFSFSSGLGNLMFQYAALRTYAETWNASVVLPANCLIRRAFGGGFRRVVVMLAASVDSVIRRAGVDYPIYEIQACCRYEPLPREPFANGTRIVVLSGYFQSFRYFHPSHEALIRAELKFLPPVAEKARKILAAAKERRVAVMAKNGGPLTFVGVHARRGMDVTLHARNLRHGHVAAPAEYFTRALDAYRSRHGALIVIVVSDSVHWARANILGSTPDEIQFPNSGYREVDLALLAACNHTVISTGTFSWWGGYLRDAPATSLREVTRFGGWPTPGSELALMFAADDYFPAEWHTVD